MTSGVSLSWRWAGQSQGEVRGERTEPGAEEDKQHVTPRRCKMDKRKVPELQVIFLIVS